MKNKILASIITLFSSLIVLMTGQTVAAYYMTPTQLPNTTPNLWLALGQYDNGPYIDSGNNSYPRGCIDDPSKYFVTAWVSKAGSPQTTTISVPYGTRAVALQMNYMYFECKDITNVNGTIYPRPLPRDGSPTGGAAFIYSKATIRTWSVSEGAIAASGNDLRTETNIFKAGNSRYWFGDQPRKFTYNLSIGEQASGSTTTAAINFKQRSENVFNGFSHSCIPSGASGVDDTNYTSVCSDVPIDSSITIVTGNAPNSPPTGTVTVGCNADGTGNAVGRFVDPDASTNGYVVIGAYTSTKNGSPRIWSPIPSSDVSSRWTATLYVQDVGPGGDQTYHNVATATSVSCSVPPRADARGSVCASGITGYAFEPNNKGATVEVFVYVNLVRPAATYPSGGAPPRGAVKNATAGNPVWAPSPPNGAGNGNHGFTYGTPIRNADYNGDYSSNDYMIYIKDNATGGLIFVKTITQGACASTDCTPGTATMPATVTTNSTTSFTVGATVSGSPAPPPGKEFVIVITNDATGARSILGGGNGHDYTFTGTTTLTSETATFNPTSSGNYTLVWAFNGQVGDCRQPIRVGYAPYFRVENGNATAGSGFTNAGGTCRHDATANIAGSGSGSPSFIGVGTQLAAFAEGNLTYFPTSTNDINGSTSGVSALTAGKRDGLAFANTGVAPGMLAGLACIENYITTATTGVTTTPLAGPFISLDALYGAGNKTYLVSAGPVTILQVTPMPANLHITIIVGSGNVVIGTNITYDTTTAAKYTSLDQAPQFKLYVGAGGKIGIDSSVTELHGVYVAQENAAGNGGIISTCTSLGSDIASKAVCSNPLTIHGAVAADHFLLERTYGSYIAAPSEGEPLRPAEVFDYSPELWGTQAPLLTTGAPKYDSITSLPPTL